MKKDYEYGRKKMQNLKHNKQSKAALFFLVLFTLSLWKLLVSQWFSSLRLIEEARGPRFWTRRRTQVKIQSQ